MTISFAIVAEKGRQDLASPIRRILTTLGHRDLTDELDSSTESPRSSGQDLDVLIIAFRNQPGFWLNTAASGIVGRYLADGKPRIFPFVVDDHVVVDHCHKHERTSQLFKKCSPVILNLYDPSVFAKEVVNKIDRAFGAKTPKKTLDRVTKREHAQDAREWKHLIEISWDQGERNMLASATDLLDCLLEASLEKSLRPDSKSFDHLFGADRPLGAFSAKIHLAFLLGIISVEERDELDLIRFLRNKFAHDFRLATIRDDECLLGKCDNLRLYNKADVRESMNQIGDALPEQHRGLEAVLKLESSIDVLISRLRKLANDDRKPEPDERWYGHTTQE